MPGNKKRKGPDRTPQCAPSKHFKLDPETAQLFLTAFDRQRAPGTEKDRILQAIRKARLVGMNEKQGYRILRNRDNGRPLVGTPGSKPMFREQTLQQVAEKVKENRHKKDCRGTYEPGGILQLLQDAEADNARTQEGKRRSRGSMKTPCKNTLNKYKKEMKISSVTPQQETEARRIARADPLMVLSFYFVLMSLLQDPSGTVPDALWVMYNFDVSACEINGDRCNLVDYVRDDTSTWDVPVTNANKRQRKMAHTVKFIPLLGSDGSCGPLTLLFYDKGRDGPDTEEECTWLRIQGLSSPTTHGFICVLNRSQPDKRLWCGWHKRVNVPHVDMQRRLKSAENTVTMEPPTPTKTRTTSSSTSNPTSASSEPQTTPASQSTPAAIPFSLADNDDNAPAHSNHPTTPQATTSSSSHAPALTQNTVGAATTSTNVTTHLTESSSVGDDAPEAICPTCKVRRFRPTSSTLPCAQQTLTLHISLSVMLLHSGT